VVNVVGNVVDGNDETVAPVPEMVASSIQLSYSSNTPLVTIINSNTNNTVSFPKHFSPVAIEIVDNWHHYARDLVQHLGSRATNITGDYSEITYLFYHYHRC